MEDEYDSAMDALYDDPVFVLSLLMHELFDGQNVYHYSMDHKIGGPTTAIVTLRHKREKFKLTIERA